MTWSALDQASWGSSRWWRVPPGGGAHVGASRRSFRRLHEPIRECDRNDLSLAHLSSSRAAHSTCAPLHPPNRTDHFACSGTSQSGNYRAPFLSRPGAWHVGSPADRRILPKTLHRPPTTGLGCTISHWHPVRHDRSGLRCGDRSTYAVRIPPSSALVRSGTARTVRHQPAGFPHDGIDRQH